MDQLTPVILFGAAAIAGHTWGEAWLDRIGLKDAAERLLARIGEALRRFFGGS